MKNTRYAILFYFLIFLYLFFFTLNCNYLEGDDASTILYHLCGRNLDIQAPYAAYNSGFDYLIQITGLEGEVALRNFSFVFSFITGFFTLVLFAFFLETLLKDSEIITAKHRRYFYFILPFLVPDIIFHSLIVNSVNISFALVLTSLIFFIHFLRNVKYSYLILSMVLLALAIPFRWTMLIVFPLYIGLFLYFHPLENYSRQTWKLLFKIMIANVLALALSLAFIAVTGYDLKDIQNTIAGTTGYIEKSEVSVLAMLASGTAFLTPSFLILLLFSVFQILKSTALRRKRIIAVAGFLILSLSPFALLGFYPLYKYSITAMPVLLLLCAFGFTYVMNNKILKLLFAAAVVLPWIIGIQIEATGTFCGPAFELDTHKVLAANHKLTLGNNPDSRIKIEKVRPAFGSGFYMPMPEGPRPMYGYAYVLLGGGWKNQVDKFTTERDKIFQYLIEHKNASYFQDRMSAFFSCDLYRHGFSTATNFAVETNRIHRTFRRENDSIVLEVIPISDKVAFLNNQFKKTKNPIVFRSSYSNDILKLMTQHGDSITVLGPFTVIKE